MEKYTQKQLKNLVATGAAKDVSYAKNLDEIPEPCTQIGYCSGLHGCSGALLKGIRTGDLYAVTGNLLQSFAFFFIKNQKKCFH